MPRLREKNPCPNALISTFPVIFEKSGLKRKARPSFAPGKVMERTPNTISMTNSKGIRILAYFSMPFCTPLKTTKPVKKMKMPCHITLRQPMSWKAVNSCSMVARSLPWKELLTDLTIYSSVHPDTVE